ncbi:uncharacterized protein LOC127878263 [Dreissena polymorpha]|uniref:uncharacterized protein LOC127878263 n=1 Tax=Dreissena polymorpha TaxID=45954 RepID=UPI002263DEE9|nr:uncharacterized protein LOC127878263 [Dreissena polymorpha]
MEGAGITAGNVGNESYTGDVYADSNTDIMADTIGQNPYINKYFTLVTQGDFLLRGLHISSITGIVLALVFVLTLTLILEVLDHWLHIQQERQTYMPRTRNPTDADNRIQWMITCHRIATLVIGHVTPTEPEEWKAIADQFAAKWQFTHAIGALYGKHVAIRCPKNGGSLYYNYKCYHSVVLMALVDADYQFIWVNIGSQGRCSDAQIWNQSVLKLAI